ncbi:MAG: asparaginase, partial [Beijerinckiaceae bacterium]
MHDPVLVEVTRGARVESFHTGAVAISDAQGGMRLALGDVARPVFPRSAVKAIQALPLIETGAADKFGLSEADIALACASHSGEPRHANRAAQMLAKAGRAPDCLECGTHWPSNIEFARALAAEGQSPSALHNNCSGKHAGFVCLACGNGDDPAGYIQADHPVQRRVKRALEDMTGASLSASLTGIDGCSIPTYAIPLSAMAQAFARLGTGEGLDSTRAQAAHRIRKAVAANPDMVAGVGRVDTVVMTALRERAFIKTGAEGVYCGAMPELGLGFALKCDDGAGRASEVAMAAILAAFLRLNEAENAVVSGTLSPALVNWNGIEVGRLRPSAAMQAALEGASR